MQNILTKEQAKEIKVYEFSVPPPDYDYISENAEEYKGVKYFTEFQCNCYDDPDSFCRNLFYFEYGGKYFTHRFLYDDEDENLSKGKKSIDKFLDIVSKPYEDNRIYFVNDVKRSIHFDMPVVKFNDFPDPAIPDE